MNQSNLKYQVVCSENASDIMCRINNCDHFKIQDLTTHNISSIHSLQYREMRYFTQKSKFSVVLYDLNYGLENEKNMLVPLEFVDSTWNVPNLDMSVRPSQFWPLVSHSNTSSSLSLYYSNNDLIVLTEKRTIIRKILL